MYLVDDLLLLDALSDTAPVDVQSAVARGELFTTGSWYYRLGRAVTAGSGTGRLSGRFERLEEPVRGRVLSALGELPEEVGLLSLRVVVPVMRALTVSRPLNFLNAEALGAALLLDATIIVTTDAPLLRAATRELAVGYETVG